jgi:protein-tyrosine phosphatase
MIEILFICLGNFCRSPMAEAVMHQLVHDAGLADRIRVDSVGLGAWHVGQPPHPGTQAILRRHHIPYAGRARQITPDDVRQADYLIVMDAENLAAVQRLLPVTGTRHLHRLLDFAPAGFPRDVPDPYFDGNFDAVYDLVDAGCRGLLAHLRAEHAL